MALTVTNSTASATVRVGCDRCYKFGSFEAATPWAAIDGLSSSGWDIDPATCATSCADCSGPADLPA